MVKPMPEYIPGCFFLFRHSDGSEFGALRAEFVDARTFRVYQPKRADGDSEILRLVGRWRRCEHCGALPPRSLWVLLHGRDGKLRASYELSYTHVNHLPLFLDAVSSEPALEALDFCDAELLEGQSHSPKAVEDPDELWKGLLAAREARIKEEQEYGLDPDSPTVTGLTVVD